MRQIYITITALIAMATMNACSNSSSEHKKAPDTDTVAMADTLSDARQKIRTITEAVRDNDPEKFASAVSYPLQRPYPLHNVNNREEMVKYYPKLVDTKLKQTIAKADTADWTDMGWKGHTLGNGDVWVDDGGLYAVNRVSPTEATMRDSLRKAEIASLPSDLRGSWTPVGAFYDAANSMVYRVDMQNDGQTYRLAQFPASKLKSRPLKVVTGTKNVEGSAESVSYEFAGGITLIPEDMETGNPVLQQGDVSTPLQSVYWLDLN